MRDGFDESAVLDRVVAFNGGAAALGELITYWCVGHIDTGVKGSGTLLAKCFGFVPNEAGLPSSTVVGCVVPARKNDMQAVDAILKAEFGESYRLVFASPKPLGFFPSCMEVTFSSY